MYLLRNLFELFRPASFYHTLPTVTPPSLLLHHPPSCYLTLSAVTLPLVVAGLFGEGPADRRERLRQLMSVLGEDSVKKKKTREAEQKKLDDVRLFVCLSGYITQKL